MVSSSEMIGKYLVGDKAGYGQIDWAWILGDYV